MPTRTATQADLAALLSRPDVQAEITRVRNSGQPDQVIQVGLAGLLAQQGLTLPQGQVIDPKSGTFADPGHPFRNFLIGAAGVAAAPWAIGALAGGGGAAAGGAGTAQTASGFGAGGEAAADSSSLASMVPGAELAGGGGGGGSLWGWLAKNAGWIVPAATNVAGTIIGANAAKSAAQQQIDASNKALAFEQQMYQQGQAGLSPYMSAGARATTTLRGLTGNN